VSLAKDDPQAALDHLMRAEELAMLMSIRPIIWQARAGAASALSDLGRDGEAEDMRRKTHSMIDEVASMFTNDEYRELFLKGSSEKLTTMFGWQQEAVAH